MSKRGSSEAFFGEEQEGGRRRKGVRKPRGPRKPSAKTELLRKLRSRKKVIEQELRGIRRDIVSLVGRRRKSKSMMI